MDIKEIATVLTWYEFEEGVLPHQGYGMLVKDSENNIFSAGEYAHIPFGKHYISSPYEHGEECKAVAIEVFYYAYMSELIAVFADEIISITNERDSYEEQLRDLES